MGLSSIDDAEISLGSTSHGSCGEVDGLPNALNLGYRSPYMGHGQTRPDMGIDAIVNRPRSPETQPRPHPRILRQEGGSIAPGMARDNPDEAITASFAPLPRQSDQTRLESSSQASETPIMKWEVSRFHGGCIEQDECDAPSCDGREIESQVDFEETYYDSSSSISYSFARNSLHQGQLLGIIVQLFQKWANQQFQSYADGCCSGDRTAHSSGTGSARNDETTNSGPSTGKRPADGRGPDGDEYGDDLRRDPKKRKSSNLVVGDRRFACPFFKHNPALYKDRRSCPGPGFKSVHRVK